MTGGFPLASDEDYRRLGADDIAMQIAKTGLDVPSIEGPTLY
jgi:hypothetical protein